jgi:hypothetical protein
MQFLAIQKRHQAAGFYSRERTPDETKAIFRKSVIFLLKNIISDDYPYSIPFHGADYQGDDKNRR